MKVEKGSFAKKWEMRKLTFGLEEVVEKKRKSRKNGLLRDAQNVDLP
jgi:hypothetical protein